MAKGRIYFLHIPKTAGTSFLRSVVEKNIAADAMLRSGSIRHAWANRHSEASFVHGHFPWGIHRVMGPGTYFTFLRDPIDRAISFYYFVKAGITHPDRFSAGEKDIVSFYRMPKHRNVMARLLAGYGAHLFPMAGRWMSGTTLKQIRRNLEAMPAFGIQSAYDDSCRWLAETFDWTYEPQPDIREKASPNRPKLTELDETTLNELRRLNALDCEAFEIAKELYEQRRGVAV